MRTCAVRCGGFLLGRLCSLPRLTVLLPALPDVHLSAQREVQVQPPVRLPLGDRGHIRLRDTPHKTVSEIQIREREDATNSDISPVSVSNLVDDRSGKPDDETQANEIPKTNKKETTIERGDPLCSDDSEIPEWLQEFRENLVDDEIPLQGGSHASSSHEASLEPTSKRREDSGKHSVNTHIPKDRNCEICKRTKNYKGSVQKTKRRSRTSSCQFW